MAFSVNTNMTSLQAQEYLRLTSDFQGKTINRVTSGLRIISSGDDAAGLSIANAFRSDQAVLRQVFETPTTGCRHCKRLTAASTIFPSCWTGRARWRPSRRPERSPDSAPF